MKIKTNAMRQLDKKKVWYQVHDYSNTEAISGVDVVTALQQDRNRVYKTLVTVGKSKTNYVFMIPVAEELDLKKAAKQVGEKNIEMLKSKELLGLTGYVHGGCSPIGMKKRFRTVIHESVKGHQTIFFSAGKVGYQIETSFDNLKALVPIEIGDVIK